MMIIVFCTASPRRRVSALAAPRNKGALEARAGISRKGRAVAYDGVMDAKSLLRVLSVLIVSIAPACRLATVYEPCVDDPGSCPICSSDDECTFQGNECTDSVYCAHVDSGLSFIEIGCLEGSEYAWPPDDECRCVEATCQWDER
jgi:hypothetical protein